MKEECVVKGDTNKEIEYLKININEMQKDRDRFYNLYHELYKEKRENEINFRKYNNALIKKKKFLFDLCMEIKEENEKLKLELLRNE